MTQTKKSVCATKDQDTTAGMPEHSSLTSLDNLLAFAERYAASTMRNSGRVGTALWVVDQMGSLLCLPADATDEQGKNKFVRDARLVCLAFAATAVVVVAEAWMSTKRKGEKYGLPSEDPDRKEVVMLLGEARGAHKQKILRILRMESGTFTGFGELNKSPFDGVGGRFAKILPPQPPTAKDQALAERLVKSEGITFVRVSLQKRRR
jgi:hypothetical protein